MILTKVVKIKPSGKSIKYYKDKGYDVQWHKELEVSVSDLPDYSNVIIDVQCDNPNCLCVESIHYSHYTKNIKTNNGLFYCKECWAERLSDKILKKYGVKNISQLEEIKEKKCKTMMNNYGVSYTFQSQELVNRILDTCEAKYGTRNIAELDSVKKKRELTNINKYGFVNPMQNPEIRNKAMLTSYEKYGYYAISQAPEIRKKAALTFYKNQSVATSKQQRYLHNLFGGELNGVISHYNCDIVFHDLKQICEYDGGGHFLSVELGALSEKDFKQKEIVRDKLVKAEGYRIIRIISRKDKLPSDHILLLMLQYARDFFEANPSRSWINFDIDEGMIYNAYHKEPSGLPFDYGELRLIRNETDSEVSDFDILDSDISDNPTYIPLTSPSISPYILVS